MSHAVTLRALSAAALLCSVTIGARAEPAELRPAPAARPTRVLLVASPGLEELVRRFVAELDSLHLETVRVPERDALPSVADLEQLALERSAQLAVRVSQSGRAIDLWLVNPGSQELVYRRLVAAGDPAIIALRSLEILRGALVELRAVEDAASPPPPPSPRPSASQPPPPPRPELAHPAPRAWLGASGALIAPHFGRSLGSGGLLSLRGRPSPHFSLEAELLVPFTSWSVAGQGGRARVWLGGAHAGALLHPWGERRLSPGLGLGLGVLGLRTQGEAEGGYEAKSELNFAFFPHGRVELSFALTDGVRVRAALLAGFASPRPVLLFANERAEGWLNPVLLPSLGMEARLP